MENCEYFMGTRFFHASVKTLHSLYSFLLLKILPITAEALERNIMDLIDRQKAIDTLMAIKKEKEKSNCSKQRMREATAIGYAIAIIKKLPKVEQ